MTPRELVLALPQPLQPLWRDQLYGRASLLFSVAAIGTKRPPSELRYIMPQA
jgi:hypothetical protein